MMLAIEKISEIGIPKPNFVHMEIALTADRLILPMTESSGGVWIMENVDQ
jgi:hypothetical protein